MLKACCSCPNTRIPGVDESSTFVCGGNGAYCNTPYACLSNYCRTNILLENGQEAWACAEPYTQALGTVCDADAACASGALSLRTRSTSLALTSTVIAYCAVDPAISTDEAVCKQLYANEDGTTCEVPQDCSSQYCSLVAGGAGVKYCTQQGQLGLGEDCLFAADCQSGAFGVCTRWPWRLTPQCQVSAPMLPQASMGR